ncbi:ribosomal protein l15 protein, partial [Cystoisospora suis]
MRRRRRRKRGGEEEWKMKSLGNFSPSSSPVLFSPVFFPLTLTYFLLCVSLLFSSLSTWHEEESFLYTSAFLISSPRRSFSSSSKDYSSFFHVSSLHSFSDARRVWPKADLSCSPSSSSFSFLSIPDSSSSSSPCLPLPLSLDSSSFFSSSLSSSSWLWCFSSLYAHAPGVRFSSSSSLSESISFFPITNLYHSSFSSSSSYPCAEPSQLPACERSFKHRDSSSVPLRRRGQASSFSFFSTHRNEGPSQVSEEEKEEERTNGGEKVQGASTHAKFPDESSPNEGLRHTSLDQKDQLPSSSSSPSSSSPSSSSPPSSSSSSSAPSSLPCLPSFDPFFRPLSSPRHFLSSQFPSSSLFLRWISLLPPPVSPASPQYKREKEERKKLRRKHFKLRKAIEEKIQARHEKVFFQGHLHDPHLIDEDEAKYHHKVIHPVYRTIERRYQMKWLKQRVKKLRQEEEYLKSKLNALRRSMQRQGDYVDNTEEDQGRDEEEEEKMMNGGEEEDDNEREEEEAIKGGEDGEGRSDSRRNQEEEEKEAGGEDREEEKRGEKELPNPNSSYRRKILERRGELLMPLTHTTPGDEEDEDQEIEDILAPLNDEEATEYYQHAEDLAKEA